MPFEFIDNLPIFSIQPFLDPGFSNNFYSQLREGIMKRVEMVDEKEIKDLKLDAATKVLIRVRDAGQSNVEENKKMERAELNIALKFVRSPFLEKRIRGMNEIDRIIELVKDDEICKMNTKREMTGIEMAEWLIQSQLIEQVLEERPHVELIKRCPKILTFLATHGQIPEKYLNKLWQATKGKHDSILKAAYNVIIELAQELTEAHNDYLFEKFREIPITSYTSEFLHMLKEFTISAIEKAQIHVPYSSLPTKLYGLPIFQELMLDHTPGSFTDLATNYSGEILKKFECRALIKPTIEHCLNLLKEHNSVPQVLTLAKNILDELPKKSKMDMSSTEQIDSVIMELNSKYDIMSLLVESCEVYISKVRQQTVSDPSTHIFLGKYNHEDNLKKRLDFIEYIHCSSDFQILLSLHHINSLWECFVSHPGTHKDSVVFYKWLSKGLNFRRSPIKRDDLTHIFEQFFCNSTKFDATTVTTEAFRCFTQFMLQVNYYERNIEMRGYVFVNRNKETIKGLAELIQIILQAEDVDVANDAISLIVKLFTKLSDSLKDSIVEIWQAFISEILNILHENIENTRTVTRVLMIISGLMGDSDEDLTRETNTNYNIFFKEYEEQQYRKIPINTNRNIAYLRKKMAQLYNKSVASTQLYINSKLYTSIDDDTKLSTMNFYYLVVVFDDKESDLDYKKLIASNIDTIDVLLELLSKPDQPYTDLVWKLLISLPTNQKLMQALYELKEPMQDLLNTSSPHKLLYCFTILEQLRKDEDWLNRFNASGGVPHILNVLIENTQYISQLTIRVKLEAELLNLLSIFIEDSMDIQNDRLLLKVFDILTMLNQTFSESKEGVIDPTAIRSAAHSVILKSLKQNPAQVLAIFQRFDKKRDLLYFSLLKSQHGDLSAYMELVFINISEAGLQSILLEELINLLPEAIQEPVLSLHYWSLFSRLVSKSTPNESFLLTAELLLKELAQRDGERSGKDRDMVLWGVLRVLEAMWDKVTVPSETADMKQLVLHNCLFEVPSGLVRGRVPPPKCKQEDTRRSAFQFLLKLCHDPLFIEALMDYLRGQFLDPSWRTGRRADWNNSPAALEKSETGYVGMKNLGCTCYMNSVLQQLFMQRIFRDAILQAQLRDEEPPAENILFQLQYIFSSLKHSDKQYINPKGFCQAFKDWDGNPINVKEQMDVDEFFNSFMDKLENKLKSDRNEHIIKNLFGGSQVTELIGKDSCAHRSEREEPFLTLPVQVKGKKSVLESLESFVEGEILEGDNAYQCDHCDAKVTALRRVCIKHLPNVLILVLRRFEFDYDTMTRLKVNDYCEFPMDINMQAYTQEGLLRKEREKLKQEGKDIEGLPEPAQFPDDYYNYKLRGIVIHMGTAEYGHYYSFIKDTDTSKWYEFNDTYVREFDAAEISNEAFGGEEKWSWNTSYTSNQLASIRERHRNAYVLLYERQGTYHPRTKDDEILRPLSFDISMDVEETEVPQVREENQKFWRCRYNFSSEYLDFMQGLSAISHPKLLKFRLMFYLTIMLRFKDRKAMKDMVKDLHDKILEDPDTALWYLEVISNKPVFKELFLDCPVTEKRRLVITIAKAALRAVGLDDQLIFLKRMVNRMPYANKPYSKYFAQYFEMLSFMTELNPALVIESNLMDYLIRYLIGDTQSMEMQEESYRFDDILLGYEGNEITEDMREDDSFFWESSGASLSFYFLTLAKCKNYMSPEHKRILLTDKIIYKLVAWADSKKACKEIAKLLVELTKIDQNLTEFLVTVVLKGIKDSQHDYKKPYMRQLHVILSEEDELQPVRVNRALQELGIHMHSDKVYTRSTQLCLDFLYKLCAKIPAVRTWVTENKKMVSWVKQWLESTYLSPQTYASATSSNYTSSTQTYGSRTQWNEATQANAKKLYEQKLGKFNEMIAGEAMFEGWDSDDDLEELQENDYVDIVDVSGQKWVPGIVRANVAGLCLVQFKSWNEDVFKWVHKDDDELAPFQSRSRATETTSSN